MKRGASVLITTGEDSVFLILRCGEPGFMRQWHTYAADPWFKRITRSLYHAWNDGVWSLPGGNAGRGESLHDCAIRELQEETGLPCKVERMRDMRMLKRFHIPFVFDWAVFHIHLRTRPSGWPNVTAIDRHEYSDSGWFSLSALPRPAHVLLGASVDRARSVVKRDRQVG